MKQNLVKVGDVFDVEKRIREIDPNYRVFFNVQKSRFEVHNLAQGVDSLCLVSPYAELDHRLIKLVRHSRVERASEIFEEIEKENEKLMKEAEKKKEEAKELLKAKIEKLKKSL